MWGQEEVAKLEGVDLNEPGQGLEPRVPPLLNSSHLPVVLNYLAIRLKNGRPVSCSPPQPRDFFSLDTKQSVLLESMDAVPPALPTQLPISNRGSLATST